MLPKTWNAKFMYGSGGYGDHVGISEIRDVLERVGNVVAVINGHVHANRYTIHNNIPHIDVSATLVGPPTVRYFEVYEDRVKVYAENLSNTLYPYVDFHARAENLCLRCNYCTDRYGVCDFIDGGEVNKTFNFRLPSIPYCLDYDQDGYNSESCGGADCDDFDVNVNPEAEEKMDGVDNNCNGLINEGLGEVRRF
jgi:hypothetical protein